MDYVIGILAILLVVLCSTASFVAFVWLVGVLVARKINRTGWERVLEARSNLRLMVEGYVRSINSHAQVVSHYAGHESGIHLTVSQNMSADIRSLSEAFGQSVAALTYVSRLQDHFPLLKADQQHDRLMDELRTGERRIQMAAEAYNAVAREYNDTREGFFSTILLARMISERADYLDGWAGKGVLDLAREGIDHTGVGGASINRSGGPQPIGPTSVGS